MIAFGNVSLEVQNRQFGSLTASLARCARRGSTAAFLRWCQLFQLLTFVLKRRMTAHQYASTWFEWLREETRGVWICVRLQCTTHFGRVNMDQSSSRGLEKFGEDILTSPEVIRAHTLHFKPNFKFSRYFYFFWGRGPRHSCGVRLQGLVNL